jgi:hypothetical protein
MVKDKQPSVVQQKIEAATDEHVFILVETPGRPAISLDISNTHGRRALSVRNEGMSVASFLLDVDANLPPLGKRIERFCPYCGSPRNIVASVDRHECDDSSGMTAVMDAAWHVVRRTDPDTVDALQEALTKAELQ